MTCEQFRRLALSLPEASEQEHMGHPDFRVAGRVFATVGYPDERWAMVKLTPMEQEKFVHDEPQAFVPVKGAWGRQGCTHVRLRLAKKPAVRQALQAAWSRITADKHSASVRASQPQRRTGRNWKLATGN
jgi:hypothetical protein